MVFGSLVIKSYEGSRDRIVTTLGVCYVNEKFTPLYPRLQHIVIVELSKARVQAVQS
jgi:hypothetical protein